MRWFIALLIGASTWASTPAVAAATATRGPWAQLALGDLRAVHDLIRDNHPGAVDPQNPTFRHWLETGLAQSETEAAAAENYADYRRSLRRYVNGFRDIHVALDVVSTTGQGVWPGFIVAAGDKDAATVRVSEEKALPVGSELLGCDGQTLDQLLAGRVDPYFYNNDIPHWRRDFYNRLFYLPRTDTKRLSSCRFKTAAGVVARPLEWREVADDKFTTLFQKANDAVDLPPMGLSQVDGIWYIRIPTFGGYNIEETRKDLAALEADITKNVDALRTAPKIVIDVRDNNGGDSSWGNRIAYALWGKGMIDSIVQTVSSKEYTEFRASPANLAHYRAMAADPGANPQVKEYATAAVSAMADALSHGQALAPVKEPIQATIVAPANTVHGKVYVLTRGCGSACLDFLDVVLHTPGVVQVGLPTLADAVYMESSGLVSLPSGLAAVAYPTKVIRDRVRKHNEWYEPKIRWSGGPMTEQALSEWIKSLP